MLRAMAALFGNRRTSPRSGGRERLTANARPAVVYAIGDVHGCLDELLQLEQLIRRDAANVEGEKWIVMLGDYIDRGPRSAQVIDHLLGPSADSFRRFALAGNHEQMLLDFLASPRLAADWLQYGGWETLASYGIDTRNRTMDATVAAMTLEARMPRSHLDWLRQLPVSLELPGFVFVHAGLRPGRPLADQDESDLLWIREPFLDSPGDFGVIVVHGHTPESEPVVRPWRLGIDTAAFATGRLTSARIVAGGEISFLATHSATPLAAPTAPGSD